MFRLLLGPRVTTTLAGQLRSPTVFQKTSHMGPSMGIRLQISRSPILRQYATYRETMQHRMRRMGNPRISNSVYKALVFTLGFSVGCYFATPYLFTYTPLSYFKRHPQQLLFGLIGVNVGVFLLWRARTVGLRTMNVLNKYFLLERGPSRTTQWSLLWSGFSHENFTHLLMNMFCLYSFGSTMIQVLGVVNFTSLYLISGVGASFASILFSAATGSFGLSLGASGAISAVFAAFATIFPKAGIAFFFLPIPGGAQMALLAFTVYNALGCVYKWGGLDYAAHLGGTFLGYLYAKKLQRERRYR